VDHQLLTDLVIFLLLVIFLFLFDFDVQFGFITTCKMKI
jgi:hypothetical protein